MPDPDAASQAWPPPPPPQALQCPRCRAAAQPAPGIQTCRCGLRFVLRAGPFLDRSLQPPAPDPTLSTLTVRNSGLLHRYGGLDPEGVIEGALDPILGKLRMSTRRIGYRGIYTIAVWRRVPRGDAAGVLGFSLPFTALLTYAYLSSPIPILLCLLVPLALLTASALVSVFVLRASYVRVVGARETLTIRFDRPFRRRRLFHDELMRRSGLAPGPLP